MNGNHPRSLHARFLTGLARSPGGPAIHTGTTTVSYAEACDVALRWAGAVAAGPPEPPRAIGVLADKGPDAYLAILAALFTGATVVPLHPEIPVQRTRHMIQAAGVGAVIADGHGAAVLAGTGLGLPVLRTDIDPGPARPAALAEPRWAQPSDIAYYLFTSGSTGTPKGVPITHGNLAHYFGWLDRRYDFGPGDVFSQILELNFDCAILELFAAWGAGGTVCTIPQRAYLDLPGFAAECGLSVWCSVPSVIGFLRKLGGLTPGALPTLRWSLFAGEALKCSDAADWQAAASGSTVENLYGPTELTLTITGHRWSPGVSPGLAVNGVVPIGVLNPGHEYRLLAPDGTFTPAEGELCITGPQMATGYLDPADNTGRFLHYDRRTWYRTGDRVRVLANGELGYLGRMDSQVQVQGMRVELAEIDQAVRDCDQVQDAVTVTRPTEVGLELVVFYTGARIPASDLARQLRQRLPEGMMPRAFVHMAEFPLNRNRKVDRIQLAATAAQPAPAQPASVQ